MDSEKQSLVRENEFSEWVVLVERGKQVLTRRMLVLNLVGLATHLAAFAFEVARGMRFNMKLQMFKYEVSMENRTATNNTFYYRRDAVSDGFVYISWLAVWIHFTSIAFHACISLFLAASYLRPGAANWYLRGLFRCRAPHRWLEYVISATLMIALLTIMMGIRDTTQVWMICSLNVTTMVFGWVTEVFSSNLVRKLDEPKRFCGYDAYYAWEENTLIDRLVYTHMVGYIPFIFMFYFIYDSFFKHRAALGDDYPGYPDYAVVGTFFLFFLFGITQFLQQLSRLGPSWYATGEAVYVALSFLAKAWLVVLVNEQALRDGSPFDAQLNAHFD